MAYTVVNLPKLVAQSTGTGSATNGIGGLDDASSVTIYLKSTGGWAVGALKLEVAQADVSLATSLDNPVGVVQSTAWQSASTTLFVATSSGYAITLTNISFRSLRLNGTSSSATNEVVAFVSKQISV